MKYLKDGFQVQAKETKNQPLPDWFVNQPELGPGDDFYLNAFWQLSTCRGIGMNMGPIPWTACIEYARFSGLDDEVTQHFIYIIFSLDNEYLKWYNDESEKKQKQSESAAKSKTKRR